MKHDPRLSAPATPTLYILRPRDVLCIDPQPISQMVAALGEVAAEEVICRALEDLTRHMRRIYDFHTACDFGNLVDRVRAVVDLADYIGLPILAKVARDVVISVQNADDIAVSATVARLVRVADLALFEVGTLQNHGA